MHINDKNGSYDGLQPDYVQALARRYSEPGGLGPNIEK